MLRRGVTILEGVTDPGHQCHCVTMAMNMHWHTAILSEGLGAAQEQPQCKYKGECKSPWPVLLPTAGDLSGVYWVRQLPFTECYSQRGLRAVRWLYSLHLEK